MLILKNKKEHKDTSIKNGMMLQSFQKKEQIFGACSSWLNFI